MREKEDKIKKNCHVFVRAFYIVSIESFLVYLPRGKTKARTAPAKTQERERKREKRKKESPGSNVPRESTPFPLRLSMVCTPLYSKTAAWPAVIRPRHLFIFNSPNIFLFFSH